MPRARTAPKSAEASTAQLERRLKLLRQWMAAEREAMEFQDFINDWREKRKQAAQWRRDAPKREAARLKRIAETNEFLGAISPAFRAFL